MIEIPDFDFCIEHRNWIDAFSRAYTALSFAEPEDVILIVAPSRAGKTSLVKQVIERMQLPSKNTDNQKRFIGFPAANRGHGGRFSTRDWNIDLLKALDHPLLSSPAERVSEGQLNRAVEQALLICDEAYLWVDETQHLGYANKLCISQRAIADSWKCLAQRTGKILILSGTFELMEIALASSHFLGRSTVIPLFEYRRTEDDLLVFNTILSTYDHLLEFEDKDDTLTNYIELLYDGSLGVIGVLKLWLRRACMDAIAQNKKINRKILEGSRRFDAEIERLQADIDLGKRLFHKHGVLVDSWGRPLSVDTEPPQAEVQKSGPKVKPFKRKPQRYEAGNRNKGAEK